MAHLDCCRRGREPFAQEPAFAETPGCHIGGVETAVHEVLPYLEVRCGSQGRRTQKRDQTRGMLRPYLKIQIFRRQLDEDE